MSESGRIVYEATAVAVRPRPASEGRRGMEVVARAFLVLAEDTTFGRQRTEYLPLERLRVEYPRDEGWKHEVYLSAVSRENLHAALEWLDTGARPPRGEREAVGAA